MDAGENIQLIDVRMPDEWEVARIDGAVLIPLPQLFQRIDELDSSKEIIFQCKTGGRSARAIEALQRSGFEADMANLVGGIFAWSEEIDPSVPKYH